MEISEIKLRLNISTVLNYYQLTPDIHNRLICPFHDDKKPSMQIYPETNTYNCFSSNCDTGSGDQIEFIELMEKKGKHQAIMLAKNLVSGISQTKHIRQENEADTSVLETKSSTSQNPDDINRKLLLEEYFSYCRESLTKHEKAIKYLKERKLDGQISPTIGGIGFTDGRFFENLEPALKKTAIDIGLINDDQSFKNKGDKFSDCIIFPLKNANNQIVDVYGRSIHNRENSKHFLLKDTTQGIFPGYPPPLSTKILFSECIIDGVSLLQSNLIQNNFFVIALTGNNSFKQEHLSILKSLKNLNEVTLFFDGDEGGKKSTFKIADIIKENLKTNISYVNTPAQEDANSLLVKQGPDILIKLLEQRQTLFQSKKKSIDLPSF